MQSVLIRCLFNLCEILFNPCNSNVRAELKSVSSVQSVVKKRFTVLEHSSVQSVVEKEVYCVVFVKNPCYLWLSYNDTNICSNICRSCWRSLMMRRSSRRFCSLSDPAIQSLMYPAEEYFCCKCSTKRSQCSSLVFSG